MNLKNDLEVERAKALIRWLVDNGGGGSQTRLAEIIGNIDRSTISNWVNPKKKQVPLHHWEDIIKLMSWDWNDLNNYIKGIPTPSLIDKLPQELLKLLLKQAMDNKRSLTLQSA